jgi:hypothetical protein
MAQITGGGSKFDRIWEERTNACFALLREAADISARASAASEAEDIVAMFLWILSVPVPKITHWERPRWPLRYFDGLQPAPPLAIESCQSLRPRRSQVECQKIISELNDLASSAAESWALGDPENPQVRSVLKALLQITTIHSLAGKQRSSARFMNGAVGCPLTPFCERTTMHPPP